MKTSVEKKVVLGFVISTCALLGMGWLSYHTATGLVATEYQFTYAYKVIATLESGRALLTDAETAQRAYLLTGDPRFLADCTNAQAEVSGWIDRLRKYTAGEPEQQRQLARLEPLVAQRLALLNDRIRLRQQKGLEAAANAVATRQGKDLMDQIEKCISEMHVAENKVAFARQKEVFDNAFLTRIAIWGGTTLACGLGLLAVVFIHRDLNRRRRAEEILQQNEERFRLMIGNVRDYAIFMLDPSGHVMTWNEGAQRIKGYTADEIVGKHFSKFYPAEAVQAGLAEKILTEATATGRYEQEGWRVRKDGSRFWADVVITAIRDPRGRLMGFVKVTRDLTERRQSEETLRQSEERYRTLFDSIDEGFCIIQVIFDDRQKPVDYRFLEINPSFEKQTGLRDALGRTMRELAPQHEAYWFEIYGHIASTGEPRRFQNRAEQLGRTYDVYAFRLGAPEKRQVAILFNDITRSKEAEEQITRLNADLQRHAGQLETTNKELEAFSYSVSHDLRAPLRHIDGFVKLLDKQANGHLDDRGRRYLDIIADSAKRMGALIDDLLVFSRMGRSEMRRSLVDSRALVDEVISSLQEEMRDRRINWKIGPLPAAEADAAMLRQVWANLIGNAVKYTRPRDPAEIEIGCHPGAAENVFFIRDNGVGFDMQYAHKLFGVFQRLHRAEEFEGTGIGLANVQRVIHRHGGTVRAESELDKGATFYFSLPQTDTDITTKGNHGTPETHPAG